MRTPEELYDLDDAGLAAVAAALAVSAGDDVDDGDDGDNGHDADRGSASNPAVPPARTLPLIQALSGFVDAGGAVRLARETLLASGARTRVATFDVDELYDYRSRRPMMTFSRDHWSGYDAPELALDLVHGPTPFLVLYGPEPDVQWERFIAALLGLLDRLQVGVTVGLNAIPMAVPHTRPSGITAHGTRRELIAGYQPWVDTVLVPASAGHLLELRLGERGRDAVGFAAHVPHYLAQADYPPAAQALLTALAASTGVSVAATGLDEQAVLVRAQIDAQIGESEEISAVVRGLEQQYDAFVGARGRESLLAEDGSPLDEVSLPSADELGAELERFLAEQTHKGDDE
ncbi:MAG: proteasome assembly chaperone family protein [Actinomycetales bacterium]